MFQIRLTLIRRFPIFGVTILLCLLYFNLHHNMNKQFKQVNYTQKDSANFAVNLSKTTKAGDLFDLLYSRNYVTDSTKACFIAGQIVQKLNEGKELSRLYDLNTRAFRVPATLIDSLSEEHTVRLFDTLTYRQIREDNALTVRTPEDFRSELVKWLVLFFAAWWGLYFILVWKNKSFDRGIIALLMLLTGFCLLTMFSIHNPLTDRMLGVSMAKAILSGVVIISILQFVDFVKFFQNNSKIKFDFPFWPKGFGYLFAALFLTALLFTPFGSEVGGMKVNLNFGFKFQPSEIAKYLIIIFMAAFFVKNADKIIKYSEAGNQSLFGSKMKTLSGILLGLGLLIGVYAVLGDMGPGLVLGITFILLYSIVKSKVSLDQNLPAKTQWKRVFGCDFAMLIYGIVTFAAFLVIGKKLGNMGIFCLLWFMVWFVFGIMQRRQIFESAVFMNLIIAAFIFGGTLFKTVGMESHGERFDARLGMCINTWGTLPLDGAVQKAGENIQVVSGLWALASGGMTGQGLGEGNPNQTPAFHTDMVLESVGEQMGWLGLLVVVVCLALLLRRTIVAGYKNGHPFAFYFATGVAIVTGVQFMVIALGSTGMIPLTGVTVPFLSFGSVSMILNLTAFGIVLSLSQKRGEVIELQKKEMEKYNYTVAITSLIYCALAIFVLLVFLNYQSIHRDETLIRPIFVKTVQGEPEIEYNPRIKLLMKRLHAGNIYDRTGKIILATSDKALIQASDYSDLELDMDNVLKKRAQRYYPFGDHLFFMLGDYNSGVLFRYDEDNPSGYLAEVQHLSDLRGFDNIRYDENHSPVKIDLGEERRGIVLRDYSYLKDMLKDGLNGKKVEKHNKERENRDITLTVDAVLQTQMQNEIANYISHPEKYGLPKDNFKGNAWNKLRISVVVLNAKNGELLASANYPSPDQNLIKEKWDAGVKYYDDTKDKDFEAYTDRDLGLTYQTAPGSTAKVMSALAGLQKDTSLANKSYFVNYDEIIERKANGSAVDEPNNYNVSMEDAIVKSSNCYFINLVNNNDLYANLDSVYEAVGIRIDFATPYFLNYGKDPKASEEFKAAVLSNGQTAVNMYNDYISKRDTGKINPRIMSRGEWQWAWGQGTLSATPLNMARVVSIVANDGKMMKTKFLLKNGDTEMRKTSYVPIVSPDAARILKGYMQQESEKHRKNGNSNFPADMGGKTGTPERIMKYFDKEVERIVYTDLDRSQNGKMNDGWYIFFVHSPKEDAPLSVAVRMERIGAGISGNAVRLTNKVVLETLSKTGYLNN